MRSATRPLPSRAAVLGPSATVLSFRALDPVFVAAFLELDVGGSVVPLLNFAVLGTAAPVLPPRGVGRLSRAVAGASRSDNVS